MTEMFIFKSDTGPEDGVVFSVPADPTTPQELFSAYGKGLRAPNGYFGSNWDAFQDVLLGLDWIKEHKVRLVHRQLPKLGDKDLATYLDVLKYAAKEWASPKTAELQKRFPDFVSHELSVEFCDDLELRVRSLVDGAT